MAEPLVSADVKGLRQLEAGAIQLGKNIEDAAGHAFLDIAQHAQATVAAHLPHRSGRLAGTVQARLTRTARGVDRARVGMGKRLPYAGWVEFGGGRYKGRPYVAGGRYLYPLARQAADDLEPAGERAATEEIRRMRWPRPAS